MGTRLCDLGWTVAKIETDDGDPEAGAAPEASQDTLTLLQPADDSTPAQSLVLVGRETLLQLRDFIDEVLTEPDPADSPEKTY